jgi:hypothetical protein
VNAFDSEVAHRARRRCEYCHAPEVVHNGSFEVEHVQPVSQGGPDTLANLALACRSCNVRKSNRLGGIDPESNLFVRLYNPRTDTWDEHFSVDTERAEIIGRPPEARATIDALDMNHPQQQGARFLWILLGIFP